MSHDYLTSQYWHFTIADICARWGQRRRTKSRAFLAELTSTTFQISSTLIFRQMSTRTFIVSAGRFQYIHRCVIFTFTLLSRLVWLFHNLWQLLIIPDILQYRMCFHGVSRLQLRWKVYLTRDSTIWYDEWFALEYWLASCQFNLAHKLKRTENVSNETEKK